jgi:hypothetical protein
MLKYEGMFQVGQRIRAYDYDPSEMPEGTEVYVEGVVDKIVTRPWKGYQVTCDLCTHMGREGLVIIVPMERNSNEFEQRIVLAEA